MPGHIAVRVGLSALGHFFDGNWIEEGHGGAKLLADSKDGEWGDGVQTVGSREAIIIRGTDFGDLDDPTTDFPRRWIKNHIADRKRLQPGDLILETAGGTSTQSTGRSVLLKGSFFNNHNDVPVLCASFSRYLRLNTKRYSPRFIYYLLQTLYHFGYMAVFNIQHTGVSRFQYTAFKDHTELQIPDLSTQRKLAAILSAYDELIENNKRRMALLEKLAEEIYREWFVRFRFPGHTQTKIVKGVPGDWEIKKLGSVLELLYGKALKDADRVPGEFPVYGSSGVVGTHNKALVRTPGLIVGRKGNVGSVYWSDTGFFPIDTVYSVKSALPNAYLYFLLKSMNFINNDSAVPGLNRNQAYSNQFFLPLGSLIKKFIEVVNPQFEMKYYLKQKNEKLIVIRNLLLPRLLTGKLSVESLDIQFAPSMAEELDTQPVVTTHA